ncbi:MAG: hypothetical protein V3R66_06010, partial [Rhodospirillales bacterium]
MSETTSKDKPGGLTPMLAVLGFVAAVHVGWGSFIGPGVMEGNLADGDSYLRLVRVTQLYETGGWFDSSLSRSNAPFGTSLHWTRLFDVLLLAVALPLAPFVGFAKALFWAGAVIAPLLHLITAAVLVWAARPLVGRVGSYLAGALSAVQFPVMAYAAAGYADHNILFGLIAVGAFGFVVRSLSDSGSNYNQAFAAGVALGIGLWAGVEMMVFLGVCLFASAVAWLFGGQGGGQRNLGMTIGLVLGVAAGLAVERGPSGFLDVEYDRLSMVHLVLAVLLAAFWAFVVRAGERFGRPVGILQRAVTGVAGAAFVGAVMWLAFPKFLAGPISLVDVEALEYFQLAAENASIGSLPRFMLYLGGALFALPWALWRLREEWGNGGF